MARTTYFQGATLKISDNRMSQYLKVWFGGQKSILQSYFIKNDFTAVMI